MSWSRDGSSELESRGVFTEIPFRGYTGWLCNYDENASENNTCVSRFVDLSYFNPDDPHDLTVVENSDLPLLYGVSYENGNWRCGLEESGNDITATCTSWLPIEYGLLDFPAIYRFTIEDGYEYKQYGYKFVDPDGDGGTESTKEWIDLGII